MEGKGLKSDYSDGVIFNVQTRRDGRAANIAPRGMVVSVVVVDAEGKM